MKEATYEFQNRFNERYSLVSRRIIRMLSENSRVPMSDVAKKLGISRQAVTKRLDRLNRELKIEHTLDFDEDKLGLINPHLIFVKFRKRPSDKLVRQLFQESYIPQVVVSTIGEYDLIVYANSPSRDEYVHWNMGMQMALADYGVSWLSSEIVHHQLGFFPLRDEILERLKLPRKYGAMIRLLNSDSRVSFKRMSERVGMHFNSVDYNFKKLMAAGYIKRFTISMQPPSDITLLSFACKYTPGHEHESNSAQARKAFVYDDDNPVISRYLTCAQLIGSYDFFAMGAFDSIKIAYRNGVLYHRQCHKRSGLKIRHAYIDKVLVGRLPINSLDIRKEYKTIRWIPPSKQRTDTHASADKPA